MGDAVVVCLVGASVGDDVVVSLAGAAVVERGVGFSVGNDKTGTAVVVVAGIVLSEDDIVGGVVIVIVILEDASEGGMVGAIEEGAATGARDGDGMGTTKESKVVGAAVMGLGDMENLDSVGGLV